MEYTSLPEVGDDSSEMSILGLFSTKVVPSRRRLVLQNDSDLLKEMKNWMSSYVVEEHRLKEECERCGKCEGLDAVRKKFEWWYQNNELHSCTVEGPLVAGSHIAVTFKMDVTYKPDSKRVQMEEIAVYKVADGKIVYEEFFYSM